MLKAAKLDTLLHIALCLLAFSIPTRFIFSSVCLVLVAILWLLTGNFRFTFNNIKQRRGLWPWFITYFLLLISYFYSTNHAQAAFDLKTKLAYLVLPVIIGSGIANFKSKRTEQLFLSFIVGLVCAAIISLINATIIWYPEKYFFAFFYHQLVSVLDPNAVYTAWYTIFSISLLLFMPWQHYFQKKSKILKIILILFLFVFFLLLSARMFILLFIVFIIPYFIKISFRNTRRGIIVTLLTISCLYWTFNLVSTSNNPIRHRYTDMLNRNTDLAWLKDYSQIEESAFNNVTLRLFLWRIGLEGLIEKNALWTGVGNGDVHLLLTEKMRTYKIKNIDNPNVSLRPGFHNANLHNMYIQILVMIGIPGLITFLFITIFPFFFIHKIRPYQPFLVFHITSVLFMMQESVLQTQAGIIFYIFMHSIFWNLYYSQKSIKFKLI